MSFSAQWSPQADMNFGSEVCARCFVSVNLLGDVPLEEGGDVVVAELKVEARLVAEVGELLDLRAVGDVGAGEDSSSAREISLTAKTGALSAGELERHTRGL